MYVCKEQLYVFYLSHKFAPTPGLPDMNRFENDLVTWFTKLRSKIIFKNQSYGPVTSISKMERTLIDNKPTRLINSCNNNAVEAFVKCVRAEADSFKSKNKYVSPDNLSNPVRKALNELKGLENIIIRPFDKGVGFFILSETDYLYRIKVHLEDNSVYEIVVDLNTMVSELISNIKSWVEKYSDEKGMSQRIRDWVTPNIKDNQPGNIYLNLKAHKPPHYPGRLITTGCSSYIENLSALTAFELKKVELEYRIIDTPHFLRKLDALNESHILQNNTVIHVAIDISNMFTNIPRDMGIQQCIKHLDILDDSQKLFSTPCIIDALKLTLDYNISSFNNVIYRQKQGAAMGPKNSCEYADCAIDYVDKLVHSSDPALGPTHVPAFWGRLRDDIYMTWIHTIEQLENFMSWLNNISSSLNFTYDYSSDGVEFLDTFVYDVDGIIHTKLFSKSSDTHCYLVPTSCHKTHVLKNIPYGVARRVRQNNSEDTNFEVQYLEYKNYLLSRGYNENLIDDAFDKFSDLNCRKDLYSNKDNIKDKNAAVIPLVIDNNPSLPNMSKIIHRHKHLLDLDPSLRNVIPKGKVFVTYRKNKTIGDMLVHNRYRSSSTTQVHVPNPLSRDDVQTLEQEQDPGCYACEKCYCCKMGYLVPCKNYKSYHTDQVFPIKQKITCQSTGLIYLMECVQCEVSYIGYTTGNLPKRLSNHKSHIKRKVHSCRLVNHFLDIEHNLDLSSTASFNTTLSKHLKVILIDKIDFRGNLSQSEKEDILIEKEGFYQTQVKTLNRYGGLNILDSRCISMMGS